MKYDLKHDLKHLSCVVPALLAFACVAPSALADSQAPPAGINGFSGPGGFTLNGNANGRDGQDATAHGVPAINGGTLHLTTAQGVPDSFVIDETTYYTFYGSENTSAYAGAQQNISHFYASFVYRYNGTNPQSFGPGNGFSFILQNDPRGLHALGGSGIGNGQQGDGDTIVNSAAVEFGLFTGFGQNRGTQLAFNGDPGTGGTFRDPTPVNLISGDPISVTLSYDGATLSETLFDTVTRATYTTSYVTNLPAAVGSSSAYVGFTGGTGAAVADQTITDFVFSNNVPTAPINTGPKITVTASASPANAQGRRTITVTTTDTGGAAADMLRLTSVTLDGATPASGSPSLLPTTPNNLSNLPGQNTQANGFYFSPSLGTTRAVLNVAGKYTDPKTGVTSSFTAAIRLSLP